MTKFAVKGDWIEIESVIFKPEGRAPNLPDSTKNIDYKQWIRGYLLSDKAKIGDTVKIKTLIDRIVEGQLSAIQPRHEHDFGNTIEELLDIGIELRHEMESL